MGKMVSPKGFFKIPDTIGYWINKNGEVWSGYKQGLMKLRVKKDGYLCIDIRRPKRRKGFVHKLVLETFIGPCPDNMECRHLDGNPKNNNVKNLCWGTRIENSQDRILHGRAKKKLTEEKIKKIFYLRNVRLFTHQKIADIFKVCRQTITDILNKKLWKQVEVVARAKRRVD